MTIVILLIKWVGVGILSGLMFMLLAFTGGGLANRPHPDQIEKLILVTFDFLINVIIFLPAILFVCSLSAHFLYSKDLANKIANFSFLIPLLALVLTVSSLYFIEK